MKFPLQGEVRERLPASIAVLLIVLVTIVIQLPYSPVFARLGVDSGIFAYGGQQILEGQLPYREFWDHKPPAVFYLNALAIFIVGQTPWAIWWLGLVWIICTSLVFFFVMRRLTGLGPALFSTLIFTITLHHPDIYQRGNFPEVYSLLFQVLTIGFVINYFSSKRDRWIFGIGILTSISFLFKFICIALGLASLGTILYFDIKRRARRRALTHLLLFGIAALVPIVMVLLYWASQGALQDLWDAVITYNLLYSQMGLFIRSFYSTIRMLTLHQPMAAVFALSLTSFIVFFAASWKRENHHLQSNHQTSVDNQIATALDKNTQLSLVFTSIFVAIPLELGLMSLVSTRWGHYLLTPLPALAASIAYLIHKIKQSQNARLRNDIWSVLSISLLSIVMLAWCLEVFSTVRPESEHLGILLEQPWRREYQEHRYQTTGLEEYIWAHTEPSDYVLLWGLHANVNFVSRRRSPSKYIYALPLLMPGYDNRRRFEEFLEDLSQDPPVLIMAETTSPFDIPYIGLADDDLCSTCTPEIRQGLLDFKHYVEDNYFVVETIREWKIFQREE